MKEDERKQYGKQQLCLCSDSWRSRLNFELLGYSLSKKYIYNAVLIDVPFIEKTNQNSLISSPFSDMKPHWVTKRSYFKNSTNLFFFNRGF